MAIDSRNLECNRQQLSAENIPVFHKQEKPSPGACDLGENEKQKQFEFDRKEKQRRQEMQRQREMLRQQEAQRQQLQHQQRPQQGQQDWGRQR